jgi:hypothetical protein
MAGTTQTVRVSTSDRAMAKPVELGGIRRTLQQKTAMVVSARRVTSQCNAEFGKRVARKVEAFVYFA